MTSKTCRCGADISNSKFDTCIGCAMADEAAHMVECERGGLIRTEDQYVRHQTRQVEQSDDGFERDRYYENKYDAEKCGDYDEEIPF